MSRWKLGVGGGFFTFTALSFVQPLHPGENTPRDPKAQRSSDGLWRKEILMDVWFDALHWTAIPASPCSLQQVEQEMGGGILSSSRTLPWSVT